MHRKRGALVIHPMPSRLSRLRSRTTLEHARELRASMTEAERRLWYYLRARRFRHRKFRRQVPMGSYVADFVCDAAGLIVEVDGAQHGERHEYDEGRSRWLAAQGYRVIRFWNHEVMGDMEAVGEVIARELGDT